MLIFHVLQFEDSNCFGSHDLSNHFQRFLFVFQSDETMRKYGGLPHYASGHFLRTGITKPMNNFFLLRRTCHESVVSISRIP